MKRKFVFAFLALFTAVILFFSTAKSELISSSFGGIFQGKSSNKTSKTKKKKKKKKKSKKKKGKKKKGKKKKKKKGIKGAKGEPKKFKGMVARHNYWRKKVGAGKLKWSKKIAKFAQKWAYHLKKYNSCQMKHRQPNKYGENIYWSMGMVSTPKAVTDAWASERFDYHYSTNSCNPGKACGHYTQLVWKKSKYIGCGMVKCSGQQELWVCNYNPPGNYIGQKPY